MRLRANVYLCYIGFFIFSGMDPIFTYTTSMEAVAAHYAPGVMERVARVRGMEQVDCMVSSPWHDLGIWLRVESQINNHVSYCRTTDVSAPEDLERHQRTRLIELDWESARRLCGLEQVGEKDPRQCPVVIRAADQPQVKLPLWNITRPLWEPNWMARILLIGYV